MLANRHGHFDSAGRAFVVTDPETPMPWVNVICNGRYGLVISQNGGGFSWYDDAQHNVLTRWEMDLVRDCYGKFLYLADRDSGDVWSVAPAPCRARYESYSCTHTLGSTTFRTRHDGIESEWTLAVAPKDGAEVWRVALTNDSGRARRLRVSSYLEWTCGVAPDAKREFHRLFFTTTHHPARRAITAIKNMWDIPAKSEREHWNVPWPYAAAHAVACDKPFERELAIADRSTFLGRNGMSSSPAAMRGDIPADGRFGRFGDAAAALGGDLTLAPGETVRLTYTITIGANEAEALALVDRFTTPAAAGEAVRDAHAMWDDLLGPTRVETGRDDFDLLNNHWLRYQAISGRLWGRTGYYQQSGAFGYRDQLQDSQVWLPIDPARTLAQIRRHADKMFPNGSVYHWWHALADFGSHTQCSDDYLWLPFLTAAYIRETGDTACLDVEAGFVKSAERSSLLDHCERAMRRSFARTSARGLPHIGSCDWNDGLSSMGIEERGESVWVGMFLCAILEDWASIYEMIGKAPQAEDCRRRRLAMISSINAHAWDGAWFRYGTKDDGEWVGAASSPEGKIHLNAQTWAILADATDEGRAAEAWSSVKNHLLSPYGPLLLSPAYTVPDTTIGYVTRYCPGSRENGGVYMHAATWALAAACKIRDVASVGKIWESISPPVRGQDAAGYWAEPYVTPGNVDGPLSDLPGRAGWTWYTGSAAWLNRVSMEWVLGIRPTFHRGGNGVVDAPGVASGVASGGTVEPGLLIDPVPPPGLGRVTVTRRWRGAPVTISFDAAEFAPGVAPTLTVVIGGVGKVLGSNVLPAAFAAGGGPVEVHVRWSTDAPRRGAPSAAAAGRV